MLKLQDLATRPDLDLGALSISPSRRLIRGPGGQASVEPLTMQVLLLLIDAAGRVVTRNELFDQCWGGTMVGDDSLNRAIGKVRRVGAEVAPGYFEVETIPRTGYRLTGQIVEQLEPDSSGTEITSKPPRRISRRTLVAGGAAAAAVAGSLAAWTVLRPRTDQRFTALFEQAHQILRYEYSPRGQSPVSLLEQALAIHPDDPAALGLLAYSTAAAASGVSFAGAGEVAAAERSIKAALAADPNDAHARLGLLLFRRDRRDWAGTEDELRAILQTAPRNILALGHLSALYQAAGRTRLSWNINEALVALDPLSPSPQFRWALKHWIVGRIPEADRMIDRLIQLWPRHPWVWNARFLIFAFTGRAHAALDMIDDAATRPQTITPARMAQWRPTLMALDQPVPGLIAAARQANLAAARESPGQAAYAIMALGGIGEIDAAFEVAQGFLLSRGKIVTRRPSDPNNMLVNNPSWRRTQWLATPPLIDFRADPRFRGLCDGIGLTAYWRMRGIRPDYPNVRTG